MTALQTIDITPRVIRMATRMGEEQSSAMMEPFILGIEGSTDKHVVCWLEWFEGKFDPEMAMSLNPKPSEHNTLKSFRSLPPFEIKTIGGLTYRTFRAVCDRSLGGKIGTIACDGGTLWTVMPP